VLVGGLAWTCSTVVRERTSGFKTGAHLVNRYRNPMGCSGAEDLVPAPGPTKNRNATFMLELRPTCENCNAALPPDSTSAMICTFECTFCRSCVENILENVCPNCGGNFCSRPVRPRNDWIRRIHLGTYPASTIIRHCPVNPLLHQSFAASIKLIPPELR